MVDRKLTELTEATEVDLTDQLYAVVGETSNRITVETLRNALDALLADNNLSELGDTSVARTNLGLGTAAEADIVGTVSQSGGDPTGAVVERGSNANGEYVRYADGTQMCWRRRLIVEGSGSTMNATWNFPADFAGTVQLSVTASYRGPQDSTNPNSFATDASLGVTQVGSIGLGNFTESSVTVSVVKQSSEPDFESGDKMYVTLQATGRWF